MKTKVTDLRKAYPELSPYKSGTRRTYGLLEWPAMRRLADRIDPSYKI